MNDWILKPLALNFPCHWLWLILLLSTVFAKTIYIRDVFVFSFCIPSCFNSHVAKVSCKHNEGLVIHLQNRSTILRFFESAISAAIFSDNKTIIYCEGRCNKLTTNNRETSYQCRQSKAEQNMGVK